MRQRIGVLAHDEARRRLPGRGLQRVEQALAHGLLALQRRLARALHDRVEHRGQCHEQLTALRRPAPRRREGVADGTHGDALVGEVTTHGARLSALLGAHGDHAAADRWEGLVECWSDGRLVQLGGGRCIRAHNVLKGECLLERCARPLHHYATAVSRSSQLTRQRPADCDCHHFQCGFFVETGTVKSCMNDCCPARVATFYKKRNRFLEAALGFALGRRSDRSARRRSALSPCCALASCFARRLPRHSALWRARLSMTTSSSPRARIAHKMDASTCRVGIADPT